MADISTLQSYITNAIYKLDKARENKNSYNKYAEESRTQAESYMKEFNDYLYLAKQYEDEELQAQRDLEYYQQQITQAEREAQT